MAPRVILGAALVVCLTCVPWSGSAAAPAIEATEASASAPASEGEPDANPERDGSVTEPVSGTTTPETAEEADPGAAPGSPAEGDASKGVVCLFPFTSSVTSSRGVNAWVTQYLAHELRRAGYSPLAPEEVEALALKVRSEAEPYDRHTGAVVPERRKAADDAVHAALRDQLGCDYQLRAQDEIVVAGWRGAIASWDGASRYMGGAYDAYGTIPAASLAVEVRDEAGERVYQGFGGIQVLVTYQGGFFQAGFKDVDAKRYFNVVPWNVHGIRVALGPFKGPRPESLPECVRAEYTARKNEKRKKRGSKLQEYSVEEAMEWVDHPGIGIFASNPENVTQYILGSCVGEAFEFVPPAGPQPDSEEPGPDTDTDGVPETPAETPHEAAGGSIDDAAGEAGPSGSGPPPERMPVEEGDG